MTHLTATHRQRVANKIEEMNPKAIKYIIIGIIVVVLIVWMKCEDGQTNRRLSKIERLTAERDFDEARALARSDEEKHQINQAQLSLLFADEQYEDAFVLSQELNAQEIFQNLFSNHLIKMLEKNQSKTVLNILTAWQFEEVYKETGFQNTNDRYNEEVKKYNALVDAIVQYSILNNNAELAKQCLIVYRPEATIKTKEKNDASYEYIFTLQDNARQRTEAKLKENKIKL